MYLLIPYVLSRCSFTEEGKKNPNKAHTCLDEGLLSTKSTARMEINVLVWD